jgi:hypothetical protein
MKRNKLIFLSAASSIMFFIILMFLGKYLSAQDWKPNTPEIEIGYRIVIQIGNNRPVIRKVRTKENLKKVVDLYFPKSDIDISEFMKSSVFFEVRRTEYNFNVETMKINNRGKFRKLSKKEIRQIESKSF